MTTNKRKRKGQTRGSTTHRKRHSGAGDPAYPGKGIDKRFWYVAFAGLASLLALRLAATAGKNSWLWGLDSLADAKGSSLALLCLFLLPFVPKVAGRAGTLLGRLTNSRVAILALSSAVCFPFFLLFRSRNSILGDTSMLVHVLDESLSVAGSEHREPGSEFLVSNFHKIVGEALGLGGGMSFAVVSALCGVAFVLIAFVIARAVGSSNGERALAFASLVALGAMQVFFGYTEYYCIVSVAGFFYILMAVRWLKGRTGLPIVALVLALAVYSHTLATILAPSFAYILFLAIRRRRFLEAIIAILIVPAAVALLLLLTGHPAGEVVSTLADSPKYFGPSESTQSTQGYAISFFYQIVNLINVLLLTAPMTLVLLAAALVPWKVGSRLELTSELGFGVTLACGALLFALLVTPDLGISRDWDIYALPSVMGAFCAMILVLERRLPRAALLWLAGAVAITGSVHLGLWVRANRIPDESVSRFNRIARNEALMEAKANAELCRYLGTEASKTGDLDLAIENWQRSIRGDPEFKKTYRLLAQAQIAVAAYRLHPSGRRAPGHPLGSLPSQELRREAARNGLKEYFDAVLPISPKNSSAMIGACFGCFTMLGPDSLTIDLFRQAVRGTPENLEVRAVWADVLRCTGKADEAEQEYAWVLERSPKHIRARLGLACLYGVRGQREDVVRLVDAVLNDSSWSIVAQKVRARLYQPGGLQAPQDFQEFLYFE